MATPTTPEGWDEAVRSLKQFIVDEIAEVHRLYGSWVSELEPQILYQQFPFFGVAGITVKGWEDPVIATPGRDHRRRSPFHDVTVRRGPVRDFPLAQWIERSPPKAEVAGSNPAGEARSELTNGMRGGGE